MAVDVVTEVEIARPREEVAAFAADPSNATAWYKKHQGRGVGGVPGRPICASQGVEVCIGEQAAVAGLPGADMNFGDRQRVCRPGCSHLGGDGFTFVFQSPRSWPRSSSVL